jgi:hypothetical protein
MMVNEITINGRRATVGSLVRFVNDNDFFPYIDIYKPILYGYYTIREIYFNKERNWYSIRLNEILNGPYEFYGSVCEPSFASWRFTVVPIEEKNISLTEKVSDVKPMVKIDEEVLKSLIGDLLINN